MFVIYISIGKEKLALRVFSCFHSVGHNKNNGNNNLT